MRSSRRDFIRLTAATAALAATGGRAFAAERTVKIGALKLIHSITPYFYEKFAPPGVKFEIIPFETPTDGYTIINASVSFKPIATAGGTSRPGDE